MSVLSSIHNKLFSLFIVIVLGLISTWLFIKHQPIQKEPLPTSTPAPQLRAASTPTATTSTTITQETKTYRNEQWGFEFQYPRNWIISEEPNGLGFYSRFELEAVPNIGESNKTFIINIVLPEFADRTFLGAKAATSTVAVAGVSGIKYEYIFEGSPEMAIVLPFGQYKMILGDEDVFKQVVSSFKFLK